MRLPEILAASVLLVWAWTPTRAAPTHEEMNEAFGVPFWHNASLWEDADTELAGRLKWPEESRTRFKSSFRLYPSKDYRILGRQPYSATLYADDGKPEIISIVFANSGDIFGHGDPALTGERSSRVDTSPLQKAIDADASAIEELLTGMLGAPQRAQFGTGRQTREDVLRWDWNGHALLLSVQEGSYVGLRLIRPEFADQRGRVERVSGRDLRTSLADRVKRRDNGDVIVTDIPMVDQGPKGYCVPATWERYLRYLGIPADMYILARAGGTSAGGGTYLHLMNKGVEDYVRRNNRLIEDVRGRMEIRSFARYIDAGFPLMWTMDVNPVLNVEMTERSAMRATSQDWDAWKAKMDEIRAKYRDIRRLEGGGHMCMIIGYNETTGEIAISDSWGGQFEERWMLIEEAQAVHHHLQLIRW